MQSLRSSGQQSCCGISQYTVFETQQINLELSAILSDHNYCRLPSKKVEFQGRLLVQEYIRVIRLEISSDFSENSQNLRNLNSKSICFGAVSPTSLIYGMEARSKQGYNRCNLAGLEQNISSCISTFQADWPCDKQGSLGKCRNNDTGDSHMADATPVRLKISY